MEEDLITRLKSVAGVSALAGTRVYMRVPQGSAYPLIRMQLIGSDHAQHMEGGAGLCQAMMQVDCIARMVADAKSLGNEVREALMGFRGTVGDTTFRSILLTDQRDLDEPDQQGGEMGHYGVSLDFTIAYQESIPSF